MYSKLIALTWILIFRKEVKEINKKVLVCALTLLTIAFLSPSLVSAETYGEGLTVETFTVIPSPATNTLTYIEELVPGSPTYILDGTVRIGHEAVRSFEYDGQLGTGILYTKTLHSKYAVSGLYEFPPGSGIYINAVGQGSGLYQYTLVIDNGPYGTGTLKGIATVELEWDYTVLFYEAEETAKLVPVEGDFDLKWVTIEGLDMLLFHWWITTTVVS